MGIANEEHLLPACSSMGEIESKLQNIRQNSWRNDWSLHRWYCCNCHLLCCHINYQNLHHHCHLFVHSNWTGLCMCSILLPPRMNRISEDDKSLFDFNCLSCFAFYSRRLRLYIVSYFLNFYTMLATHNVPYCSVV